LNRFEEGTASRKKLFKLFLGAVLAACPMQVVRAQDLAPRAYIITPIHSNAVLLTYSFYTGGILFNNTIPITDGTAKIHVSAFSFYHTLNFFGRSANITATLPYGVGHFQGKFMDNETKLYRSGLLDSTFRVSVNLIGGPAMSVKDFQKWQQKTILGLSLKVVAPTGQYDGTKLINNGSNRWAFKPELGYSRRWGHWVLDGYGAVWFFTTNPEFWSHNAFYPGTRTQSQNPIGAFEGHLSYDVRFRLWFSLDANTWFGGATSVNGGLNPNTFQTSSLIGASASIPLGKHQSLKFAYNNTDYVQFGGNYQNVSVAWQYSWLGRPN
jgi:outer membrane putative beta-barrel porin/alpha-amylase